MSARGLNYNHLYYFYVATIQGTFKEAANQLNLSPSTISEQIVALETYFDKPLLIRSRQKLRLTAEGQTAFRYAKSIFDVGEKLDQSLLNQPPELKKVEIGVTPSVVDIFQRNLFVALIENPETRLRLHVGEIHNLASELYGQSLDILISHEELTLKKGGIRCDILQDPRYLAVVGPKYKNERDLFPDCLNHIPGIHFTNFSSIRWEIDNYFMTENLRPQFIAEIDDIGIIKSAISRDLGFAILPEEAVAKDIKEEKLFVLGELKDLSARVFAYYNSQDTTALVEQAIKALTSRRTVD